MMSNIVKAFLFVTLSISFLKMKEDSFSNDSIRSAISTVAMCVLTLISDKLGYFAMDDKTRNNKGKMYHIVQVLLFVGHTVLLFGYS